MGPGCGVRSSAAGAASHGAAGRPGTRRERRGEGDPSPPLQHSDGLASRQHHLPEQGAEVHLVDASSYAAAGVAYGGTLPIQ